VSPTSERQKLRRMLQSARAIRTSSGVVGGGNLMLLPVGRRRRRRLRGGRFDRRRGSTEEEHAVDEVPSWFSFSPSDTPPPPLTRTLTADEDDTGMCTGATTRGCGA